MNWWLTFGVATPTGTGLSPGDETPWSTHTRLPRALSRWPSRASIDEGKLDYDKPVADYWRQFGAERKFGITVAQALSHQAGVYTFHPAMEPEDLYNWQKAAFNVASQAPAWEPGTAFGYHSITWGYIAGELVRQTTGKTTGEYLRSRITNQLEAEFHIGLTGPEQERCAEVIGPNHARPPVTQTPARGGNTLPKNDPALPPYRVVSSADWRNAEIPATNGHGSSLGIARCYQAAIAGKLFSRESLQLAVKEETNGETDLCLDQLLRRSRGFILNCEPCYYGPSTNGIRARWHRWINRLCGPGQQRRLCLCDQPTASLRDR